MFIKWEIVKVYEVIHLKVSLNKQKPNGEKRERSAIQLGRHFIT